MNNEQIIQKIRDEQLKPISRSVFMFKKIIIWFMLFATTMVGVYVFALIFLKILFVDFDNWFYLANSYEMFIIDNIPVIWVILFILSTFSMLFLFKKTNSGYRYSIVLLLCTSLLISLVLGISLSRILIRTDFVMRNLENERVLRWTEPGSGRILGEVLYKDYFNEYILIRDIRDNVWNIDIKYILDDSYQTLNNNQIISIIGRLDYADNFTACQILPFDMDQERFKPKPGSGFSQKIKINDTPKDVCDFVINRK